MARGDRHPPLAQLTAGHGAPAETPSLADAGIHERNAADDQHRARDHLEADRLPLLATGARRIGLEDPYHPDYRAMITGLGATAVPVTIDDDGMRVDLLDGLDLDAVVVTPAHQYPTGAVLSPERRARCGGGHRPHPGQHRVVRRRSSPGGGSRLRRH